METPLFDALFKFCDEVTLANAFPPMTVGLTAGQMQQVRDEFASGKWRNAWKDDGFTITIYFPVGPLRLHAEAE